MTKPEPASAPASLIERAATTYDFKAALRAAGLAQPLGGSIDPPPAVSAPVASAFAPQPVAHPTAHLSAPWRSNALAAQPAMAPQAPSQPINRAPMVRIDRDHLRKSGLIVPGAAPSILSEEMRIIKRQLLLSAFGGRNVEALEKGRLILVCSAQPNEGKTFCSVNLALSMASESEIEVLLVDADVAKPEVLSIMGMPGGRGLMDALADRSLNVEDFVLPTDVDRLLVLPAGSQANNDTELLASDRTAEVIAQLIANNPRRIVIFDSAPALAASPASAMALLVGQVMLVVRADRTSQSELSDSLELLDGCPNIRLLLNSVTFAGTNRKFGSYYGFGE